ncbi:MAG TPA: DUF1302 domain-containing protein [Opitutaceae bacterium]|nr:DUF1302 domain-containing protein [Opitutaceae bacterium]
MNRSHSGLIHRPALLRTGCLLAGGALFAASAHAFTFELGELKGSFDSTLSAGAAYRLSDPAPDLYATSATFDGVPGTASSVNGDDGNLNYGRGFYSTIFKGTHDLELKWGKWAAFFRTTYFYDPEVGRGEHQRVPLSTLGRKKVEHDLSLLDAYVSYQFDVGTMPANLRFGRQVLSWGESTFIPNGINAINPVDVSRLRTPGSELREALKPVPMISGSIGVSEALSFDAFYLLAFKKTDIDPRGSYFSTNDFASVGGQRVYLGFGSLADTSAIGAVPRGEDRLARHQGQFGVAAHYLASNLGDTEFGLYALNYHSRLPLISAFTPTRGISPTEVLSTASSLAQANLAPVMVSHGYPAAGVPSALNTLLGAAFSNLPASLLPASLQPFYPAATQIATGAKKLGFLSAAATGRYVLEYPEDIQLYGASFNTTLGGFSLQGELSYKPNQPLQADDVELLFAAVSALDATAGTPYGTYNQLGNYSGQYGTYVRGYRRHGVWQGQASATKLFGRFLGASSWSLVAEVAAVAVPSLEDKSVLRYDAPGTYTSNNALAMIATGNGAFRTSPGENFAHDFSAGAQLLARFEYNDVFAGVNLAPSLGFGYDFLGNTPLPLGNFVEGRRTLTLGLEFTYQNRWTLDLRYVNYAGAGPQNLLHDRDFVSSTIKYSF